MAATDLTRRMLVPPTVTPPTAPLKPLEFLFTFVRNPLRTLPKAAYQQPFLIHSPTPRLKIAWICDPAVVEDLLLNKHGRFKKNVIEKRILGPVLKEGVLIAEGASWRWQRHAMAPPLRPAELATYVPMMAAAASELIANWRTAVAASGDQQQPFYRAIDRDMVDVTFAIIARTMLAGGEPAEADLIKREGDAYLEHTSWELAYCLLNLPGWLPHPSKWRMHRAAKRIRSAVWAIVRRRRAQPDDHDDLLARLLEARDPESGRLMDEEQVVNNVVTLLAAGHETTAKALTWTLYLLARAPDWQERAREEVQRVAGSGPITADHLDKLDVVERVLKESMRLYPPIIVIARTPSEPLELMGEHFKPGDQLTIPIYCIHRSEYLWDDPDAFDPDRFLPEREKDYPRCQFLPFGGGARICLGMSFAMMEAKVILATILQQAKIHWDGRYEPEPVSRVTLRARHGMPLGVELLTPQA